MSSTEEISSESQLYQAVAKRTLGSVHWERVEPSNESGFPDTYFVLRNGSGEGTVEFKYKAVAGEPRLASSLMRGTQKAALLEYHAAGGNRRWILSCNGGGLVRLYSTGQAVRAVRGELSMAGWSCGLLEEHFALELTRRLEYDCV